jgi:hypothetical protein
MKLNLLVLLLMFVYNLSSGHHLLLNDSAAVLFRNKLRLISNLITFVFNDMLMVNNLFIYRG